MTLHLAYTLAGLTAAKSVAASDDKIVALGSAVKGCAQDETIVALTEDFARYGISNCEGIDYADLVELTTRMTPVVSWHE